MEDFSKDEISKLEQFKKLFKVDSLTREQIEAILGRPIEPATVVSRKPTIKRKVKKLHEPDIVLNLFRDEERRALRKQKKEQIIDFHIPNIFRESHSDIKPYKLKRYANIVMKSFVLIDLTGKYQVLSIYFKSMK